MAETKEQAIARAERDLANTALALFDNARELDNAITPSEEIIEALVLPVAALRYARNL